MEPNTNFDLTPSPRVLRMLGQVDFKPWQCLAELADNAVDAFFTGRTEGGMGVMFPQLNIEVSSASDIRGGGGQIKVSDNAPGMDRSMLERAVKAGYSSNNAVDKLGLFGMGFNVATARLGSRTEVWTTQADDEYWWGVRIDFDEMEKSDHFQVPALTRPKTPAERSVHGTEIVITKLDKERALYLKSPGGIRVTRDKLSRVYNKIMREAGLKIMVSGQELKSRDFCTWSQRRSVPGPGDTGPVPAVIPVDIDLGERQYCNDCWVWLVSTDQVCPACGSKEQLQNRPRKIAGWIGIQRFFDQDDFGIDLVRNGRVIEERSKVFFSWSHPEDGTVLPEYPIEQQHWGGRIVGELNIDFVPLASHQKDAFDRNTPEWKLVMDAVHGDGPILPNIGKNMGFDPNQSPLARLHAAYRRGHPPGLRTLVPGDAKGGGINRECQNWAAKFWEGDPDYQSDDIWWNAVRIGEEGNRTGKGAKIPSTRSGDDLFPNSDGGQDKPTVQPESPEGETLPPEPLELPEPPISQEQEDPTLSKEIKIPELPGSPTLEVTTYRLVVGALPSGLHMEFAVAGNRVSVVYDPRHSLFANSLTEPAECLAEELAYQLLQRSNATQKDWPISRITQLLKERHFPWAIRSYEAIREQCATLLDDLTTHYEQEFTGLAPLDLDVVSLSQRSVISQAVARIERAGEERVTEIIRNGSYPKFLGYTGLLDLLQSRPDLAFDGHFFTASYRDVDDHLRPQIVDQVVTPLRDTVWAVSFEGGDEIGEENRILLARADAGVRLLQSWRE